MWVSGSASSRGAAGPAPPMATGCARRYVASASACARSGRARARAGATVARGVLVNERFQLANKLGVQSEVELCLDASFESGEAKLLETPALDRERGDVDDVAERAAMPERKSLPKPISRDARRPSRQRGLTFPDEQLEPSGVHLCLLELEYVATPASNQCGIGPQERARASAIRTSGASLPHQAADGRAKAHRLTARTEQHGRPRAAAARAPNVASAR